MTCSRATIGPSRREFLKRTAAAATLSTIANLAIERSAHAAGSDVLKVGLIGCGGRGNGAALDALNADKGNKLVALADVFSEPIPPTLERLKKAKPEQVDVKNDHCFAGFDAYRQLLSSDVDAVLLALPSHFHCIHLKAAVEAGKHVFCEKPHAVDAPGVKIIGDACQLAKQKNLAVVSGLCWRYHAGVRETVRRIHDGAIGQIVGIRETYMKPFAWTRPRRPDDTEMKYQVRNWYNFHWLSGDLPGLTLVHSLDKGSWVLGEQPPQRAWGLGGRQVRTGSEYGDVYDHLAIVYEYANGVQMHGYVAEIIGGHAETSDIIFGTKGRANLVAQRIEGETNWHYQGPPCNMYSREHEEMFASIRAGKPINNGNYMATSTMLAVLGRMATYTGRAISWQEAINSRLSLAPERYDFAAAAPTQPDKDGKYPIAMPGVTKFV